MNQLRTIARTGMALSALFFCSCNQSDQKANKLVAPVKLPDAATDKLPGPVTVPGGNAKMQGAIEKARETVDQFIGVFNAPQPSQSMISIKMKVSEGENSEHMWMAPESYTDGKFRGKLLNDPVDLKGVRLGDSMEVAKGEISDWMYVENGKLVGGYTMRVMRDTLSPQERQDFERNAPFKIED